MGVELILIGVTGGIAAYKAAELTRIFVRRGHVVQAVLTPAATRFISPLTFRTLTGRPVPVGVFDSPGEEKVQHVDLAGKARVLVIAPASASTIGKMTAGVADNFLTTLYLALRCPVVVVPSMNEAMYASAVVQENLETLRRRGVKVMTPDCGELACGTAGPGRLPEPEHIFYFVRSVLSRKDFEGIRALVTAGPTREPLDPVRFLSSPSSGRMGYACARALAERGAAVTLISGPGVQPCPPGVDLVRVTTAREMYRAVLEHFSSCRLVIKAAAVSDYRPARDAEQKIKKSTAGFTVELVANPDILLELGRRKEGRILVGFAAETENIFENARKKLACKNLDLVVANDLTADAAGFAVETNRACLIDRQGGAEELPLMKKEDLAHCILDRVAALLAVSGT